MATVMTGGGSPNSYFKNSKLQEEAADEAKIHLVDGILEKLELDRDLRVFFITDLGCSVGPNTFSSVNAIIDAVKSKYQRDGGEKGEIPEFHVSFNDQVSNDFNTLFKALPKDTEYFAAGVPGSFSGRLFPKSINLTCSSTALHWLTKVPDAAKKENKGKITYARSSGEVEEAFKAQFFSDMKDFLNARSEELAPGGLLAMLIPCRPEGISPSESLSIRIMECLADALVDMVNEGILKEEVVDNFNIPMFFPMASEMKEIVGSTSINTHLSIETLQEMHIQSWVLTPVSAQLQSFSAQIRAALEGLFCDHFGPMDVDDIFNWFPQKIEIFLNSPSFLTGRDDGTRVRAPFAAQAQFLGST